MSDNQIDREALEEARAFLEQSVVLGFLTAEEMAQRAVESIQPEHKPDEFRHRIVAMIRELVLRHIENQASWPATTDCDRLDAAFRALEAAGIVARQNFSCCGTCGVAEIYDEIAAQEKALNEVRGYTFYTAQDTEQAVDGYGISLHYGASIDGEEAALSVGREVAAVLRSHGLRVDWNETLETRLIVPLDWKRRRTAGESESVCPS